MVSPQHRPGTSLDRLPTELLHMICSELCLHCRRPSRVVDISSKKKLQAAHADQAALAKLARCSKRLLSICQPFLFHFYHTGFICQDAHGLSRQSSQLIAFLCAIIRKPHLAQNVTALAFDTEDYRCHRDLDPETQHLFEEAGKHAGFCTLSSYRRVGYWWMQELIISLSPSLAQLSLRRLGTSVSHPRTFMWMADSPIILSRLQYLRLLGRDQPPDGQAFCARHAMAYPRAYPIERENRYSEIQTLLQKAPNLEILNARDCGGYFNLLCHQPESQPWGNCLGKLRKLQLSNLEPDILADMLKQCSMLENLELSDMVTYKRILRHEYLTPISSTLQRLSYSIVTEPEEDHDGVSFVYENWRSDAKDGLSFGGLSRLETLEIPQILMYHRMADWLARHYVNCDRAGFLQNLPPRLQTLHVQAVIGWTIVYQDLLLLSEVKSRRFPGLRLVNLDMLERPRPDELSVLLETLSRENVTLNLCQMRDTRYLRGVPPYARPVDLGMHLPVALFTPRTRPDDGNNEYTEYETGENEYAAYDTEEDEEEEEEEEEEGNWFQVT
ncbi:hypothetical protein F4778DRAFT_91905 [Xylariomycetidae sp. FL2044]|nr:hypothetical protein F4778DRAFT_91905 [Xylariomycetidae sp. FL2044]